MRYAIGTIAPLAFLPGTAAAVTGNSTPARTAITVFPRRGIGNIRLGEKRTSVARALGPGRLQHGGPNDGAERYRSGSITIFVSYDTTRRVDGVMTHAHHALLYGHRLSEGLSQIAPIVHRHRWKQLTCQGETFTFVYPGGPGTGIAWKSGKLDEVYITGGGSIGEQCLPFP